jgi:hypothetical protein
LGRDREGPFAKGLGGTGNRQNSGVRRRTELTGRSVGVDEVREVERSSFSDSAKSQTRNFVFNPTVNRKSVQVQNIFVIINDFVVKLIKNGYR